MNEMARKALLAASSFAVLLALGACGDRVDPTQTALAQHPSVEINRQGMEGASDARDANGVAHHTATAGDAPEHRRWFLANRD